MGIGRADQPSGDPRDLNSTLFGAKKKQSMLEAVLRHHHQITPETRRKSLLSRPTILAGVIRPNTCGVDDLLGADLRTSRRSRRDSIFALTPLLAHAYLRETFHAPGWPLSAKRMPRRYSRHIACVIHHNESRSR
jgi:hypothetical protein